jgi:hypothetical protein
MKRIKFNYEYLVFLYAYLRQIDLSLDRVRWGNWSELKEYYKGRIPPLKVAQSLEMKFTFRPGENLIDSTAIEPDVFERCYSFLLNMVCTYYLSEDQAQYCYQLLSRFDSFLNLDVDKYNLEMERLREDIAKFNYINVVRHQIKSKDADRAMHVECFLQSENLKVNSIYEFVKGIKL